MSNTKIFTATITDIPAERVLFFKDMLSEVNHNLTWTVDSKNVYTVRIKECTMPLLKYIKTKIQIRKESGHPDPRYYLFRGLAVDAEDKIDGRRTRHCKYCTGDKALLERPKNLSYKGDFYPGMDVSIDGRELFIFAVPDTYEPEVLEKTIEIAFCPMCGKKL